MTRKKKRRMEMRRDQEEMKEEYRREREESGQDQKKRLDEDTMKATARAKKMIEARKRDVDDYEVRCCEERSDERSRHNHRHIILTR